ncbi:MAG: preprotein translocase subunit SecG [Propionibacterium sp.]
MSIPLMTWPTVTLSIVLMVLSFVLTAFILLHKSRGGGLSDLFGGGMSTAMSGTSSAERMLDRLTIIISVLWLACILGLLVLQRHAG